MQFYGEYFYIITIDFLIRLGSNHPRLVTTSPLQKKKNLGPLLLKNLIAMAHGDSDDKINFLSKNLQFKQYSQFKLYAFYNLFFFLLATNITHVKGTNVQVLRFKVEMSSGKQTRIGE